MNNLLFLIGPSASGKTTTEDRLLKEKGYERLVSDTTREIRPEEVDGVNYNFLTIEQFLQNQYANVIHITDTWKYGVSKEELLRLSNLSTDSIYSTINIEPSLIIAEYIKRNNIPLNPIIFFFDIDKDLRISLMRKRGETEESIQKRLEREDKITDFTKFGYTPNFVIRDFYSSYEFILEAIRDINS